MCFSFSLLLNKFRITAPHIFFLLKYLSYRFILTNPMLYDVCVAVVTVLTFIFSGKVNAS